MIISRPIPNFWAGVSQQARATRRPEQAEVAKNVYGTIVDGLRLRPSTAFRQTLPLSGVTSEGAVCWLTSAYGSTFLVIATDDVNNQLFVFNAETGYQLELNWEMGAKNYITTGVGSASVQRRLRGASAANALYIANNRVTVDKIYMPPGPLTGTVQSFANLPTNPAPGNVYRIRGTDTTSFATYYVRWSGTIWEEYYNPQEPFYFDAFTLPVCLRISFTKMHATIGHDGVGYRMAGDNTSNPPPSIINRQIHDVFFFRGRLGFLTAYSVVLSQIGDYLSFFATSVLDARDDDPIDISISSNSSDPLWWAIPYEKHLLVSGAKSQYMIGSGESPVLSTKTISSTPTTSFAIETMTRPYSAGPNIYFIVDGNNYVGLREYFVLPGSLQNDAADVTSAVPRLIPAGPCIVDGINHADVLFVRSLGKPRSLFVNKYFWVGEQKAQNAWYEWEFNRDIVSMIVFNTKLFMVTKHGSSFFLEELDTEYPDIGGLGFHLHADKRRTTTATWDGSKTTWDVPTSFFVDTSRAVFIRPSDKTIVFGSALTWGTYPESSTNLAGSWIVGEHYESEYQFSELFIQNDEGIPVLHHRIQIIGLRLEYEKTAQFEVEVKALGRGTRNIEFSPNREIISAYDQVKLLSGASDFPVFLNSKEASISIRTNSPFPLNITGGSWKLLLTPQVERG